MRQRAQAVGSDLIDQLYSIDSNNYFDAMGTPGKRGGQQEAQFAAFSLQAAHAAQACNNLFHLFNLPVKVANMPFGRALTNADGMQASLRSFLKVMPSDEVEAARQQAAISVF